MAKSENPMQTAPKSDPWALIAEEYALADSEHPIRRLKAPEQKQNFK